MVKKVRVGLHGFQNRGIMIDAEATDGATIGKNLFWPNGDIVTYEQLEEIAAHSGAQIDQNTLNAIIASIGNTGTAAEGEFTDWPLHKNFVDADEALVIPPNFQYLIAQEFTAEGDLTVEAGGELIIFDRPLPPVRGPAFTEDVSGNLTQIDYDDGSQKIFTYNGDQLSRVDLIRDGWTFRKDFVYSGETLTDVNEYYV